tara:strand:- start:208 stop:483 length:276 start_codon:yes stop_codon:yes gene_type:complete
MNRKQRRAAAKQAKQDGNEELSQKIGLFDKIGDSCLTCDKPFDKKNKEMVMSWSVVVREQEGVVRLYCPDCWSKAIEIMEDFKQRIEEREE